MKFKFTKDAERIIKQISQQNGAYGITLDADGGICKKTTGDVLTLTSINVYARDVVGRDITRLISQFGGNDNLKVGVFLLEKKPGWASIDINIIVPKRLRNKTLAFAKANGQESIYSLDEQKVIPAGGGGNSVLEHRREVLAAAQAIAIGQFGLAMILLDR